MATQFFGQVNVQFETNGNPTEKEIKEFRRKYKQLIDEWDTQFLDLLDEFGIESDSVCSVFEDDNYPLQKS